VVGESPLRGVNKATPYGCEALPSKTLSHLLILRLIQMAITYQRTMKIKYGPHIADIDFRKLVGELSTKDIFVCGNYDIYTNNDYGFSTKETHKTHYSIYSDETADIMQVTYRSDAVAIVEGLEHLIDGLGFEEVITTSEKKQWAEPKGSYIVFTGIKDGENTNIDCWGNNGLEYDNGTVMQIRLMNTYEGLRLIFTVNWAVDTIQRKDKIEEAMVEMVMADMGKIQAVIEGRMKLKKFGINVEDVEINCHFDAKTESRSACTPDIIKQVRDARKGLE
jgi:hypothetical protein